MNSCKICAKHSDKFSATIYDRFITQIFFSSFSSSSSQAYFFCISYNTVGVEDLFGQLRRPRGSVASANWETRWPIELHQSASSSPLLLSFLSRPFFFFFLLLLLYRCLPFNFFSFLCEFLTCLEDNGFICCRANHVTFSMRKLSTKIIVTFLYLMQLEL